MDRVEHLQELFSMNAKEYDLRSQEIREAVLNTIQGHEWHGVRLVMKNIFGAGLHPDITLFLPLDPEAFDDKLLAIEPTTPKFEYPESVPIKKESIDPDLDGVSGIPRAVGPPLNSVPATQEIEKIKGGIQPSSIVPFASPIHPNSLAPSPDAQPEPWPAFLNFNCPVGCQACMRNEIHE